ncbi:ATP-dependent Lon protease [Metabacillus litoralis]|uniref:ATP-dependent Lon protease n=1 Tax=Metabacillus TaxID=2675233 RepID=UPI001B9D0809|nr:ATP-dependent Lon protease [Metabacillus litoralis]MCM3164926.1 ATP-dependent Lon protease [Metabacillus litoralis]MCM3410399.1 ATP-dependent Lon protease [Metabacillus litoralis]UHA58500.1 ATP-dependent Lon protease [Metabacillus litoralis]
MKLFLSIIIAGLLGLLVFIGPVGIYLLCATIVGVLFRTYILIREIHKQVVPAGGTDKAKEVYERYLIEKGEK